MIVLNLTAFLSPRTSNCSLRSWASKFPKLLVTKPASQSHRLLSLLLSVPHTSFVKAEEGLPLDRSMTGPRSHTEGVAESALDNPSVAPEQMAPSLSRAPTLVAHITSLDEAPGLHQQHHVSPLQVLGAVGAQQPRGVAQHSQDAPVQQVVGHVRIHGGQRVIKEIELLLLGRGGGIMDIKSSGQNPDLS